MLKLNKKTLEKVTNKFNRSDGQIQFLFDLLGGGLRKLVKLELKIKQHHVFYCPSTMCEVNEVLALKNEK